MRALLLLCFFVFVGAFYSHGYDDKSSCVKCHSDKEMLTKLGYPQMYLDPKKVEEETRMPGVACVDCHLGNPNSMDKNEAHKGMPRPFYAAIGKNHKYEAVGREVTNFAPIVPKGEKRITYLIQQVTEEIKQKYGINRLMQLYYHDHDNKTMAYSPKIAQETCGKCHPKEQQDYDKSSMGLNKYQRAYKKWNEKVPGNQNCGVWWEDNYEDIKGQSTKEFTKKMSEGLTRGCNKCHASCLDCHYQGHQKSEARHVFAKKPDKLSCYGSGKGEICHSGPMDRRRGAGYLREEFAYPYGVLKTDIHAQKGIECTQCHKMKDHSYGHLASKDAKDSCQNCHKEIVLAVKKSNHKNVDCTSCHIKEVGAYQFTFWGPGMSEGQYNIYTKHKEYYGIRTLPTLIKHPATNIWIPVKPYPMGVMNMKVEAPKTGLTPRIIPKTTIKGVTEIGQPESFIVERKADQVNDFYISLGNFSGFEDNDNMSAWIQMDKMSHGIGKARDCQSCHSSHDQVAYSDFKFDVANVVKKPFTGSYTIKVGKDGITFSDLKYSEIVPVDGRKITDFAPFTKGIEMWNVKGIDLSIPFNEKRYGKEKNTYDALLAKLDQLSQKYADKKDIVDKLKGIRVIAHHNVKMAEDQLKKMRLK